MDQGVHFLLLEAWGYCVRVRNYSSSHCEFSLLPRPMSLHHMERDLKSLRRSSASSPPLHLRETKQITILNLEHNPTGGQTSPSVPDLIDTKIRPRLAGSCTVYIFPWLPSNRCSQSVNSTTGKQRNSEAHILVRFNNVQSVLAEQYIVRYSCSGDMHCG